jgi:hypothetical protein
MSLVRIVEIRDAVNRLCAAIDAGDVSPTEAEMVALAVVVARDGGPLAHDLLCKLASRCQNGRAVLNGIPVDESKGIDPLKEAAFLEFERRELMRRPGHHVDS